MVCLPHVHFAHDLDLLPGGGVYSPSELGNADQVLKRFECKPIMSRLLAVILGASSTPKIKLKERSWQRQCSKTELHPERRESALLHTAAAIPQHARETAANVIVRLRK